jgi:hypothetical protein
VPPNLFMAILSIQTIILNHLFRFVVIFFYSSCIAVAECVASPFASLRSGSATRENHTFSAHCQSRLIRHHGLSAPSVSSLRSRGYLAASLRPAESLARRTRADSCGQYAATDPFPSPASTPLSKARPPLPLRSVPPSLVTGTSRGSYKPPSAVHLHRTAFGAHMPWRAVPGVQVSTT